jgi:transcriptional regulator with XRE-family HTH domain
VAAIGSFTARRRELGSMLRSFRVDAGLTAEQVAWRLGVSRSKISRLENGQRGATQADVLRLCELYQVDEADRLRLTELAAEGKQRAWWSPFNFPHSEYIGLEAASSSISDWCLALAPGLLQTPEYARAVVRGSVPEKEGRVVDERVQERLDRQRLLYSEAAPRFEAILDESVLHRVVGSPAVMLGQLRRLLEVSELPNVSIRVVPYDAGAVPAGVSKFRILRFGLPNVPDIVQTEELTRHRNLDAPGEVEIYEETFRILAGLSADSTASRAMILEKLKTYDTAID